MYLKMDRVDFDRFLESDQAHLEYAVILALHKGQWLFVKHCLRDTWELPGGHRKPGENILQTAHRELFEETGAREYQLAPISGYSVSTASRKSYGLLCFASIDELGPLPDSEIERTRTFTGIPDALTYPTILPILFRKGLRNTGLLRKFASYKHIVFDWNGTLLDDTQICVDVISDLLSEHGLPRISLERYREIFGFPVIDYYRKLGFDFERTPFSLVGDHFIERYRKRLGEAQLFEGVPLTLEILKKKGVRLSILSAAAQHHLDEATANYGLRPFLDLVFGTQDHYASSKLERGRELIKTTSIPPSNTLLIGDTDHDLEVGANLGVDILLVADGHQHYERLLQKHPNTIYSRFD